MHLLTARTTHYMLESLRINHLGPAPEMAFTFGSRVNLLTGDNGLGKSFVLDLAWWALTRTWADGRIIRPIPGTEKAQLSYVVHGQDEAPTAVEVAYSLDAQGWPSFPPGPPPCTGLAIYARVDGGFSLRDPVRNRWQNRWRSADRSGRLVQIPESFQFRKREVWEGLRDEADKVICRGLVEDWETWRLKSNGAFAMLTEVLAELSPGGKEHPLRPGPSVRLPDFGAIDVPTLQMSYGQVPIDQASAAIRRMLSLAYIIVWAWTEHRIEAEARGQEPSRRIVLLWDEIEAHLHPQWQRTILPSVVGVLERLLRSADGTELQVIATTHAPLVLASMETTWKEDTDRLFNLELTDDGKQVIVEPVRWARFGDATGWLTSPAFDMPSGYAREAERAIDAADHFMAGMMNDLPEGLRDREAIHNELSRTLDGSDAFWTLWLPFYREGGSAK